MKPRNRITLWMTVFTLLFSLQAFAVTRSQASDALKRARLMKDRRLRYVSKSSDNRHNYKQGNNHYRRALRYYQRRQYSGCRYAANTAYRYYSQIKVIGSHSGHDRRPVRKPDRTRRRPSRYSRANADSALRAARTMKNKRLRFVSRSSSNRYNYKQGNYNYRKALRYYQRRQYAGSISAANTAYRYYEKIKGRRDAGPNPRRIRARKAIKRAEQLKRRKYRLRRWRRNRYYWKTALRSLKRAKRYYAGSNYTSARSAALSAIRNFRSVR